MTSDARFSANFHQNRRIPPLHYSSCATLRRHLGNSWALVGCLHALYSIQRKQNRSNSQILWIVSSFLLYLVDLCQSVSSVASRQHLRSASQGFLSCISPSSQQLWSAGFFCGRPCDMELVTRQSERSGHQQRLLQAFTEDVFIFSLLMYIVH